jgi:alditol oxidase
VFHPLQHCNLSVYQNSILTMQRKEFLKTSSVLVAGSLLSSSLTSCHEKPKVIRKNWAGNYQYKAENFHQPKTVEEVQSLVKKLDKQKALGSCHCFNDIADSPQNQISTLNLNKIISIDEKASTVTVEAGAKYGQFAPELDKKGYALHNLASLPHISVAGACATATHGSGVGNGNLASAVSGLELVAANGDLINLSRHKDGDKFNGAVVNLGALGIVTKVTLDIQKSYQVRQDVFQDLPLQSLKDHFNEILSSGYSVSLFTDWQDQKISQVWVKRKVESDTKDLGKDFFGAKAATKNLHPITKLSAENCTEQMGVAGVWYERLPHFKMGFTPSSGEELQSEFFVPKENALEAILALEKKGNLIYPELMITEIRTIAADNFWMSTAYKQDSVAIHFTWKQHTPEVMKLIPMIEAELAPFQYRPHWGKLFTIAPKDLHSRYEKYGDFMKLIKEYDSTGKFRNPYLDLNIY